VKLFKLIKKEIPFIIKLATRGAKAYVKIKYGIDVDAILKERTNG